MIDLSIQDFKDLSSQELVQILLNEQAKIFGQQESPLNQKGDTRPFLGSLAGLIIKVIEDKGGENVTK
jgi:hypothetical protein